MRTRNSIDIPRPSPPEDPSQGNYYTHWQDFHHLLKPANGLSGKATNSLVGDLVMQSLFLVVVLKKHKKKKKLFNQGHSVPFMLFVFILLLLLF
jgi:hypothetical protein